MEGKVNMTIKFPHEGEVNRSVGVYVCVPVCLSVSVCLCLSVCLSVCASLCLGPRHVTAPDFSPTTIAAPGTCRKTRSFLRPRHPRARCLFLIILSTKRGKKANPPCASRNCGSLATKRRGEAASCVAPRSPLATLMGWCRWCFRYGLAWSPQRKGYLLSGSDDSKVIVWDVQGGGRDVSKSTGDEVAPLHTCVSAQPLYHAPCAGLFFKGCALYRAGLKATRMLWTTWHGTPKTTIPSHLWATTSGCCCASRAVSCVHGHGCV